MSPSGGSSIDTAGGGGWTTSGKSILGSRASRGRVAERGKEADGLAECLAEGRVEDGLGVRGYARGTRGESSSDPTDTVDRDASRFEITSVEAGLTRTSLADFLGLCREALGGLWGVEGSLF